MEKRFATYDEAVRYAAQQQSEGLFAKVVPEVIEGEHGPGYLVRVSSPEDAGDDPEPFSPTEQLALGVIRFAVWALLGVAAGWALLELIAFLFEGGLIPVLLLLAALVCAFYALAGWSRLLSALVGRSRSETRSPLFAFVIAFIGALLVGLTMWIW